jgi:hypothetical protein
LTILFPGSPQLDAAGPSSTAKENGDRARWSLARSGRCRTEGTRWPHLYDQETIVTAMIDK